MLVALEVARRGRRAPRRRRRLLHRDRRGVIRRRRFRRRRRRASGRRRHLRRTDRASTSGSPAAARSHRSSPSRAAPATPRWCSRTGGPAAPSTRSTSCASCSTPSPASTTSGAGGPTTEHPFVSPGTIVPTVVHGGEWEITYPASCTLTCEAMYLPTHLDADGTGRKVEAEIKDWIERAVAVDPWFAEHPLRVVLGRRRRARRRCPHDHPIVLEAWRPGPPSAAPASVTGFDSWHDGATFTRLGGTPTICFGPGPGTAAHTIDEWVHARRARRSRRRHRPARHALVRSCERSARHAERPAAGHRRAHLRRARPGAAAREAPARRRGAALDGTGPAARLRRRAGTGAAARRLAARIAAHEGVDRRARTTWP